MRTAIELGHIGIGLLVTWLFAWFAAWSYPLGRHTIWTVAYAVMAAVVALGARPVLAAYRRDRTRVR